MTSQIQIEGEGPARTRLAQFVEAVNAKDAAKAFEILKDEELTVGGVRVSGSSSENDVDLPALVLPHTGTSRNHARTPHERTPNQRMG